MNTTKKEKMIAIEVLWLILMIYYPKDNTIKAIKRKLVSITLMNELGYQNSY